MEDITDSNVREKIWPLNSNEFFIILYFINHSSFCSFR